MPQSFEEYWGFPHEDAVRFLADYREYFSTKGLFENEVYPGIFPLLSALKEAGCKLYIATTKPTTYSQRIADHFGFSEFFEIVSGSDMNLDNSKYAVIDRARKACSIDMTSAIMVGDRSHDVSGAHEHGIPCVGVTWGFGSKEELRGEDADYIVNTAEELQALLLS